MNNVISYVKNSSLTLVSLLVVFLGFGAVLAVLEAISWERLIEWSGKAALVVAVLFVLNAVIGLIVGLLSNGKK